MIDALENRLQDAMQAPVMVDAMLRGIESFDRYRDSLPFIPAGYTRTLLLKRPEFELVAMQWSPGSTSAIHDHGTSRCWVMVMDGTLDVENFDRKDDGTGDRADILLASSVVIGRGELDHRLNWRELHRVRNIRERSAYSLQLYSPTLVQYHTIDEHGGYTHVVPALYDFTLDL